MRGRQADCAAQGEALRQVRLMKGDDGRRCTLDGAIDRRLLAVVESQTRTAWRRCPGRHGCRKGRPCGRAVESGVLACGLRAERCCRGTRESRCARVARTGRWGPVTAATPARASSCLTARPLIVPRIRAWGSLCCPCTSISRPCGWCGANLVDEAADRAGDRSRSRARPRAGRTRTGAADWRRCTCGRSAPRPGTRRAASAP